MSLEMIKSHIKANNQLYVGATIGLVLFSGSILIHDTAQLLFAKNPPPTIYECKQLRPIDNNPICKQKIISPTETAWSSRRINTCGSHPSTTEPCP